MAWTIPKPAEIADQASTDFEEALAVDADGIPRVVDARSNRSVLAVFARVIGLALYPVYLYLAWVARQLFPDKCDDAILPWHARIWGVDRLPGAVATGEVIFAGAEGTIVPAGTVLTLSGASWSTNATAAIGGTGSVAVAIRAAAVGASSNQPAGAKLSLQTAIVGLAAQTVTVAAGGIAGGSDRQSIADWRQALLDHIREPAHGGALADYKAWVKEALPSVARVSVYDNWIGAGSVGVVICMADDDGNLVAATPAQVAVAQAHLDEVKPVTANVVVLAATLRGQDVAVAVSPYSAQVEATVKTAIAAYFRSKDIQVGEPLRFSRLEERISRAAGEDWHHLVTPPADVTPTSVQILVPGTVSVTEAT
jgi:uncharacterized phage protein gp47/JayE